MTTFAIVAAALVAAGLAWLLRPLLSRHDAAQVARDVSNLDILADQLAELDRDLASGTLSAAQHGEARAELERRALEEGRAQQVTLAADRGAGAPTAIALAFCIPVAAGLLYLQLGSRDAFSPQASAAVPTEGQPSQQDIDQMVAKLAERMRANPGDPEGWKILARTYYVLQRFPEAVAAYARLAELRADDADVLADYADALAMTQGRALSGRPLALIQRALEIDPTHLKALALAGTEAYERRDYRGAAGYWEKLRGTVPPDSEIARSINESIADARQRAGMKAGVPSLAVAPATGRVAGTVSLSAALAAKADPNDTVFIFARAAEGPRMPLAILRKQVKDLPVAFALDDAMAMAPQMKLSAFTDIVVGARVSRSGTATPQSGDLEGVSPPVKLGASGIAIVIDRALP